MNESKINKENIKHDLYHLEKYKAFCDLYEIEDVEEFVKLYDIFELVSFLPAQPTQEEKNTLQELVGVVNESGYMDYQRSTNTFELIMQWQEKLGQFGHYQLPFKKEME